jgi:hypothetical protein
MPRILGLRFKIISEQGPLSLCTFFKIKFSFIENYFLCKKNTFELRVTLDEGSR